MKLRRPSHGTVIAYVALFVALGGSTYAVSRIDSRDVADNSLRSKDLRDRKAVANRDVRPESLTGKVIREDRLEADRFVTLGNGSGQCEVSSTPSACAEVTLDVPTRTRALVIGAGQHAGAGVTACQLVSSNIAFASTDLNGDSGSFVVVGVGELAFGRQSVRMDCHIRNGDAAVTKTSITVLGLGRFE